MRAFRLRSGGDRRGDEFSVMTGVWTESDKYPDRTIQSGKDDADINVIVKRFGITKTFPVTFRTPEYGDYSGVGDFHTAMNAVRTAQETFAAVPSDVRKRFGNDPQLFLEFCSNPENVDELVKMGLAVPRETVVDSSPVVKTEDSRNVNAKSKRGAKGREVASGGAEASPDSDAGGSEVR